MRENFPRSLIGYKEAEVENAIEAENAEFEKFYREYNQELFKLINENQRLKGEVEKLNNDSFSSKSAKERIMNLLYDAHIKYITSLLAAEEKLNTMVREKTDLLQSRQNKLQTIKLAMDKLLKDMQVILEDEVE